MESWNAEDSSTFWLRLCRGPSDVWDHRSRSQKLTSKNWTSSRSSMVTGNPQMPVHFSWRKARCFRFPIQGGRDVIPVSLRSRAFSEHNWRRKLPKTSLIPRFSLNSKKRRTSRKSPCSLWHTQEEISLSIMYYCFNCSITPHPTVVCNIHG